MNSNKDQIDEIIECPICLDVYDEPKLLPCQHTFCSSCITNLVENGQIKCPECRSTHKVTDQRTATFPTNITIQRLLDFNLTNIKQKCFQCSQRRDNSSKCDECNRIFCFECKKDHRLELKNEIQQKLTILQTNIPKLNNKVEYYKQENAMIQKKYDSTKKYITFTFNKIMNELKKREQSLHAQLNINMNTYLEVNNSNRENAEMEVASVTNFCDSIQLYIKREDNQDTNQINRTRKQFEEIIKKITNSDKQSAETTKVIKFNLKFFFRFFY
jgi:hypothetical protein